MLSNATLVAFVGASSRGGALEFYRDRLGLPLVEESPVAVIFSCGEAMLRVALVEKVTPAPYTVLGWEVRDVRELAQRLARTGVDACRFDGFAQDSDGIWTSPGGARVIWFRDPDGNLLSATQPAD